MTDALRAKYDASQADQSDTKGRKLTYTNPKTKVQRAFFIPQNEKEEFGDKEEILTVINEAGDIAMKEQLENMLGTKSSARYWKVEKYGE